MVVKRRTLRFSLTLTAALSLALPLSMGSAAEPLRVPEVPQRFGDLFERRTYRYRGGVYDNQLFQYRLFVPRLSGNGRYPILVWLHGYGEAGLDNVGQLAWLGNCVMTPPWRRDRFPFFLLCVQCPPDNEVWDAAPPGTPTSLRAGSSMIHVNDAILTRLLEEYPIDPSRIYVAGISSGGSGCWAYAMQYPRRFAAVAPLAGGRVAGRYDRLTDVPVWCFHSTHDIGTPVAGARQNVAELRNAGGRVKLTEIESASHDCWTAAFARYDLLAWLLTQRQGRPAVMDIRPWHGRTADWFGQRLEDWTWPQLAGQLLVLALLATALTVAVKRFQP